MERCKESVRADSLLKSAINQEVFYTSPQAASKFKKNPLDGPEPVAQEIQKQPSSAISQKQNVTPQLAPSPRYDSILHDTLVSQNGEAECESNKPSKFTSLKKQDVNLTYSPSTTKKVPAESQMPFLGY